MRLVGFDTDDMRAWGMLPLDVESCPARVTGAVLPCAASAPVVTPLRAW
jgi:hypothetical protein